MKYLQIAFNTPAPGTYTYLNESGKECGTGYRVIAPFGRRKLTGFVVGTTEKSPEGGFTLKSIERVIDNAALFDEKQIRLAEWISAQYLCSLGEALSAMLPGGRRDIPVEIDSATGEDSVAFELAPQQESALKAIREAAPGSTLYLNGVTGSGKTEVFLRAAQEVVENGKGVIYLVPEIALTHQLIQEITAKFPNRTAILHSALTPSERLSEWSRIRRGEAQITLGARSAVFAPIQDLGLIIIDEEHESSYKSSHTPRYHARQVAMHLCREYSARLLMGSATPSVEAWYHNRKGNFIEVEMPARLSGGSMPAIEIVDMRREQDVLSQQLIRKIHETREQGRQTVLFLNRRGFAYFFHCRSCGFEMRCTHCAVSLTYHKDKDRMVCHYCGYSRLPVKVCPDCGSLDVGYSGSGTEHVEERINQLFPGYRIARIDTDSVRKKGVLKEKLEAFRAGEIDLLLGTQMVAKGLNFPGVKLVGIVMADTGLHLPDFRARERTFALLMQVAGRAGRFLNDGEVLVQTYNPESETIALAAEHQVAEFYRREIEDRRELGFPPYTRLLRLVVRGRGEQQVRRYAEQTAEWIRARLPDSGQILGPAECPLARIAGNFRYQLLIRTGRFRESHAVLSRHFREVRTPGGLFLEYDVDPVSLL